jgi:ribosome-binding factor A
MKKDKTLRQKKVESLLQEILSRSLLESSFRLSAKMISVTAVEITKDLQTAHVYLSIFGEADANDIIEEINHRKGYFRKAIASQSKLKYNPMLIFHLDPRFEDKERIEKIFDDIKNDDG